MPPTAMSLPRSPVAAGFTAFLASAVLSLGLACAAQARAQPPTETPPAAAASSPASHVAAPKAAASAAKSNGKRVTKPLWSQLTPAQQQALAPLASTWDVVSESQKRKWLALSRNFPSMSGEEQAKLHSRMSEWAALSPQQRTLARLNFGQTQQLSPDDKKAKWEAYQALPPEEKRKLAASAAKPPATAAAVKPVPPEKLANVPKPRHVNKTPRIAAAPGQVDYNTLLPHSAPAHAPAAAAPIARASAAAAPAAPAPAAPPSSVPAAPAVPAPAPAAAPPSAPAAK
jgi:hypothetical protein